MRKRFNFHGSARAVIGIIKINAGFLRIRFSGGNHREAAEALGVFGQKLEFLRNAMDSEKSTAKAFLLSHSLPRIMDDRAFKTWDDFFDSLTTSLAKLSADPRFSEDTEETASIRRMQYKVDDFKKYHDGLPPAVKKLLQTAGNILGIKNHFIRVVGLQGKKVIHMRISIAPPSN